MFVSHKSQNDLAISVEPKENLTPQRLQAAAFSVICLLSALFVAAAATRIPAFLEAGEMVKVVAVVLFGGVVLLCAFDNIRTHLSLSDHA